MKRTTKSLIKSYAVVSGFIFLIGFLFPPMIFHSNPVDHPMLAIYSGLFTLIVSWVFLIAGCIVRHSINKSEPHPKKDFSKAARRDQDEVIHASEEFEKKWKGKQ